MSHNKGQLLTHTQASNWSFPSLIPDEIVASLHELGITCNEELLISPDKDKDQIKRILEQLCELCIGISRDEMSQPAFSGLSSLIYPSLHNESVPLINSFRAISKMMDIVCVTRFNMKDLSLPTSKRLCRVLSGIINFAKFREERFQLLRQLESSRQENLDKRAILQDKYDAMTKRLISLKEQAILESEIITRIENDCGDLENKMYDMNVKQGHIREEIGALKSLNNDLKNEISSKSVILDDQNALKKRQSSQIVTSPEKFRRQIIDVGQALKTEQNDTKIAEKRIRDLMIWIANLDDAQLEVNMALEAVGELRSEVEREKNLTNENDLVLQKLISKKQILAEVEQNVRHLERQVIRGDEKLQLVRKQTVSRGSETQQAVEDLHRQLLEAESMRQLTRQRADKADQEAVKIHKEVEAEINSWEKVS